MTQGTKGMTLHEADTFRTMLDNYFEDRTYRASGGVVENGVTLRTLMAYVDNLLAAKDAEIAALKARQITRGAEIRILVVGSEFYWLSGHIKGREAHCDTFWRKDFPNGITQTADTLPFNPTARVVAAAAWNELLMMINTLLDEGYAAVRVMEKTGDSA